VGGQAFRGLLGKAGLGLVFLIELLSEGGHLSALEVGEDRSKLTLAALNSDYRHQIRHQLKTVPQREELNQSNAEALSNDLTPEEQLQILALIPTRELAMLVDRLVLDREILVQPEELRTASLSPPRSSRRDLPTELSSNGLRSQGRRELVRLQTTITQTYKESATIDNLRWRIRAPESKTTAAALADHIQSGGPLATVRNLIMSDRSIFDKVSDLVFLRRFPDEDSEQVETRLLWKLGFNLPRYGGAISLLRLRLDEFNQCLLRVGAVDSEEERGEIRRSGVNLFVSLEDFLERLVSYNLWLCASDHFIDTKFGYNRHDAVIKVPQVLGTSVRSGDETFTWNSNGENTIGTTQVYLWRLIEWFSECQSRDKNTISRSEEDYPFYARHPEQVFAFCHVESWADFDRSEFDVYIDKIKNMAQQLAKSDLAGIRNWLDHKRSFQRFPTTDSMLAMVSRVRDVLEMADVHRLIPKRFWLEKDNLDRYGRGMRVLKDYADRPYSLAIPMLDVSMPRIGFDAPIIIGPGCFLAEGAVPIVLSVKSTGEYAKYWSGYPRRRQIPPPKTEVGSEHLEGNLEDM
jgi:hypothetical protein